MTALTPAPFASLVAALRIVGPIGLALAAVVTLDQLCARRGLLPPGFRKAWRRALADTALVAVLWVGVFHPIGEIGLSQSFDPARIATPQLFLLHGLMVLSILIWWALGYVAVSPAEPVATLPAPLAVEAPAPREGEAAVEIPLATPAPRISALGQLANQLGFRTPHIGREIGLGLGLGIGAWGVVVVCLVVVALVVYALHGDAALPKQPPAIVPWIAALPIGIRVAVSLSAGLVEETFFRGFLQPRVGIALSTSMFALAHLSYGQPFMLLGITVLSLIYAFLVRWRQTVWPAIAAHALFDGVQLLLIIPMALRFLGKAAPAGHAVAALLSR